MVSVLGCNSQEMLFKGFVLMRDVQSIRFSSSHQHPTESGPSQRDPPDSLPSPLGMWGCCGSQLEGMKWDPGFSAGWKTTFEALFLVKSNQPTIAIRAAGYPQIQVVDMWIPTYPQIQFWFGFFFLIANIFRPSNWGDPLPIFPSVYSQARISLQIFSVC